MRFILIGLVVLFGLTEGGKKRQHSAQSGPVGVPVPPPVGFTGPSAGSVLPGISTSPAVSAPPAASKSEPVPSSTQDEQSGPVRPLTQVDPQLVKILASRPDHLMSVSIYEAEKFLGPGSRRIIIDWIELCLLPLQMHRFRPLERRPCKVMDSRLMTLDDGLATALREKIEKSFFKTVVLLDPAHPTPNHVWEVLKQYPDVEVVDIESAIQSVVPGAVVTAGIVEPLREKMLFLTRIPLWLHLAGVKATFDRSFAAAKQLEEAVIKYAQQSGKSVPQVGRMMVSWGILCVEPLFAWYNNPVGPMPCSMDDSGETISLSPEGRGTYNL